MSAAGVQVYGHWHVRYTKCLGVAQTLRRNWVAFGNDDDSFRESSQVGAVKG